MKTHWDEYSSILRLWEGKEEEYLHFSEIAAEMAKKGWYSKKVNRRLDEMVENHILDKNKTGIRGAESRYRKTEVTKEFDIIRFFEDIRKSCTKKRLIIKDGHLPRSYRQNRPRPGQDNSSLLVYGIPTEEKLTLLEQGILEHFLKQIDDAFENLLLLKNSIKARETINAPLHSELILNYTREKIEKFLGKFVITEAEITAEIKDFYNIIENMSNVVKKFNISGYSAERNNYDNFLLTLTGLSVYVQKNYTDDRNHVPNSWYIPKGSDSHLAILKTLPPSALEEYERDPHRQILELIADWIDSFFDEKCKWNALSKRSWFDDADIYHMSQTFVNHMAPGIRESPFTLEKIAFLAELETLTIKLKGRENHEKLIRCIFHFWQNHQNIVQATKKQEEELSKLSPEEREKVLEPKQATFKMSAPKNRKRITPEILAAVKTKLPTEIEQKLAKHGLAVKSK
jgi:hypothetical protein